MLESNFWRDLASNHQKDLLQFGFNAIKRRQSLKYFNWRWHVRSLFKSEQLRSLICLSKPTDILTAMYGPHKLAKKKWNEVSWSIIDRWLYSFAVWLLWNFAQNTDKYGLCKLPEPELGNPFPVFYKGRLISQDLGNSILETHSILEAMDTRPVPKSIVEIGAGYGRNAYVLMNLWPDVDYTILDVEPALSIAKWYLTSLFPDRKIRFVDVSSQPSMRGLSNCQFDLGISISSLQEMSTATISAYSEFLNCHIKPHGIIYLKQWKDWFNPVDKIRVRFPEDYEIPVNWRNVLFRRARVQTSFWEGAWERNDAI